MLPMTKNITSLSFWKNKHCWSPQYSLIKSNAILSNLPSLNIILDTFFLQVRIFGVTVLVAAWWLDAAAKGIPPTIPVVNFNTVIISVKVDDGDCHKKDDGGTWIFADEFRGTIFRKIFLGNAWHLQQEAWQPALQQGGCVIIGFETWVEIKVITFQLKYTLDSTRHQDYIKSFLSLDPASANFAESKAPCLLPFALPFRTVVGAKGSLLPTCGATLIQGWWRRSQWRRRCASLQSPWCKLSMTAVYRRLSFNR